MAAVAIVVITAFAIIGGLGWLISREATKLAADLPNYRITLSEKIASLRATTSESKVLKKAGDVLTDLQAELNEPAPDAAPDEVEVGEPAEHPKREPVPVVIQQPATDRARSSTSRSPARSCRRSSPPASCCCSSSSSCSSARICAIA